MNDNTTSHVPARPLRADARRNRELLLITARAMFSEGQLELRMDEVARRAGVGIGTLYRHFETRDALIEAIYHQDIVWLCSLPEDLLSTQPADAALGAFLTTLIDYAADNRGLTTALCAVPVSGRSAGVLNGPAQLTQALTQLLHAGVTEGRLRDDADPATVTMVLISLGTAQNRPDWQTQAQKVIALLLDGLRFGARGLAVPQSRR